MPSWRTVVLVGHCLPDKFMLSSAVKRALPGVVIAKCDDLKSLEGHLDEKHLLLVNRILDGRFENRNGIELIERLAGRDHPPVLVLVSNYEDAQARAESVGARPGFGKRQLHEAITRERLQAAAG